MANVIPGQARFVGERARALAHLYLTRRPDLAVYEVSDDVGYDLNVHITSRKPGLRQFGVELRGRWSAATKAETDTVLRPTLERLKRYGPYPFPVCVFFFTMQEPGAWYFWAAEPHTKGTVRGAPPLAKAPDCRILDDEAVDRIVAEVDEWFDTIYADVLRGKGGPRPAGR